MNSIDQKWVPLDSFSLPGVAGGPVGTVPLVLRFSKRSKRSKSSSSGPGWDEVEGGALAVVFTIKSGSGSERNVDATAVTG